MGYWDNVTKDSIDIDGLDAFDLQFPRLEDVPIDIPEYPQDPPLELNPIQPIDEPPPSVSNPDPANPGPDPNYMNITPDVLAKLPGWLQTAIRNGTATAAQIRQFIPDYKPNATNAPGPGEKGPPDPMLLAAGLATAYNHYKDSDRYVTMAEKYADQMDPFGKQRPMYQDQLARLMSNPEEYLKNDPAYKSMLRLGVDPAMSKMRARGYGNSGNILSELTRLSGDVTNKYVGDLRKDLGGFAGANIGPGAAASLLSTGMQGSINSRNQALGDIFAGIMASGGTGSNSTISSIINAITNAFKPSGGTKPPAIITDPDDPGFIGPPAPGPGDIPNPVNDDDGNPMPPVDGVGPMPLPFQPTDKMGTIQSNAMPKNMLASAMNYRRPYGR